MKSRTQIASALLGLVFALHWAGCSQSKDPVNSPFLNEDLGSGQVNELGPSPLLPLKKITILSTNDIHGSVEPQIDSKGRKVGGMAYWAGVVGAIKQGIANQFGQNGGVLVLDGGDQFQGTLISNVTEGALVFDAMGEVGYDAVVPGNHDYDFGPKGWKDDRVNPANPDQDPRSVIKDLISKSKFDVISANTFEKSSLVDSKHQPVEVKNVRCEPKDPKAAPIEWSTAKRPSFLNPYVIKTVAGVKVAIIGIDNPSTPETTTPENVSDLCFRDEIESYLEVRQELQGRAQVFLMIVHNGDSKGGPFLNDLIKKLNRQGPHTVDAVIAGHTHSINNVMISNVPGSQSGSSLEAFGRIDLVFDPNTGQLDNSQTVSLPGLDLAQGDCDKKARSFCKVLPNGAVLYEGIEVKANPRVEQMIQAVRAQIAPIAKQVVGFAEGQLKTDRISESPLANILTDAFRAKASAEIAFINTGGIRAPLPQGDVTYEDLFKVLPFNNHGFVIGPMPAEKVFKLVLAGVDTCGDHGALMQSGLKIQFLRNCNDPKVSYPDPFDPTNAKKNRLAKLMKIETFKGEVIYDASVNPVAPADPARTFEVATLDFLASGGSGYSDFIGTPLKSDMGILRDLLADQFLLEQPRWQATVDNRWSESKVQK